MDINIESFKFSEVKERGKNKNESTGKDYIYWGEDNLYPNELLKYYNLSPTNASIINYKTDLTIGDGFVDADADYLEPLLERIALDLNLYGGYAIQVITDKRRKNIGRLEWLDISAVRCDKNNPAVYWISEDWSVFNSTKIPINKWNTETLSEDGIQLYVYFQPSAGMKYYTKPDYDSALSAIERELVLQEFNLNNLKSGYFPGMLFNIPDSGQPNPEKRRKVKEEIKKNFQGSTGAAQAIVNFKKTGEDNLEVTPIQASNNVELLINITNETKQQIITAHKLTSPELIGISTGGADFGGDANKIDIAYTYFYNTTIKKKQNQITRSLKEITGKEYQISNSKPINYMPESVMLQVLTQNEIREQYGYEAIVVEAQPTTVETPEETND